VTKKAPKKASKHIASIFTNDSLPSLFADSFRELDVKWNKIEGIEFELVGRILICHLIIEHYLTVFIELEISRKLNLDKIRLTFSQKLKLIEDNEALRERGIIKGIEIINKIRNKFSHNLKVVIEKSDIKYLQTVISNIHKKDSITIDEIEYSDLATIEAFTSMICAFMAGYCTATVHKLQELKKIVDFLNEKTGRNK
jgi:uncharacterized protein YlxP (DUF503 family)